MNSMINTGIITERKIMKNNTKSIAMIGMFTAIISVLSIITIPMPTGVPVTLQTFAIALCGCVLGYKMGTISTIVYILLGTVGVPVFAGMHGGASWVVSYSGGFIWGFIFMTLLCGIGIKQKNIVLRYVFCILGLAACHVLGVIQYAVIAHVSLLTSFLAVSVPFMIKDVISVVAAYLVSIPIRKALSSANILTAQSV